MILLCGRYEGFDERIRLILEPEEISIGDYVLNGGEVAAMVMIDATIRLVPGVLGDEDSSVSDSFSGGRRWLECAQYTRPREYRGYEAPAVLLSGNHEEIARWREENSRQRTLERRKDLLERSTKGRIMSEQTMALVEKSSLKPEVSKFEVGDTVDVHCRILEGDKERIQIFNGLVIARAGSGTRRRSPSAASCRARAWSGSFPSIRRGSPRSR